MQRKFGIQFFRVFTLMLLALNAMPWPAFAAELVTAEVTATPNEVTVEQGQTANFPINLSATGPVRCTITSANADTAQVMTVFSISSGGAVSANTLSAAFKFFAGSAQGGSGNCNVTWTGASTPYSVNASVSVAATTPVGHYNIVLSPGAGTTQITTNPGSITPNLGDATSTTIVVHVVPPSDTTPPVIIPSIAGTLGSNGWYVSNVTLSWTVTDAQSALTFQSGCGTTNITVDQVSTTYTCSATSAGGTNTQSVTIQRDATAPNISATLSPTAPAGTGWYNSTTGAPTVSFTCSDSTSGLAAACPALQAFGQGAGQSFSASIADLAGNSNSVGVSGLQVDTIPPTLDAHADVLAEATGGNGAIVAYNSPATSDSGSGVGPANCAPAAGSQFALGNTPVLCSATDTAGNTATSTFNVTVQDMTPPDISQPTNLAVEAVDANGAMVTYDTPTATDLVDGNVAVSCTPASDSTFPLGANTVTCTAPDSRSNTASKSFTIDVQDTNAPVLTLPGNLSAEATSAAGTVVNFIVSASDAVDGPVAPNCSPAPDSTFSLGTTPVECTATDTHNNTNSGGFEVTVEDTTAPVIAAHDDETAEATSASGAVVNYTSPATSDAVDGAGTASCAPASGSTFSLGNTGVTCSATDAHGNPAAATTFVIYVVDTTPPQLSLSADQTVEATGPDGAVVNFMATANDLVDGAVTPVCTLASGSTFPLGETTVTCTATDTHGNTSSSSFKVTVQDITPPQLTLPADQTAEAAGPNGAIVNFAAIANDIVDGGVLVTCTPADGATFPLGTTTVQCSATDAHSNTVNGSFKVTVLDTTAPVLTLPDDITVEATGPSGAVVTYAASATDLVDGSVNVSCNPASGSTFPVNTTVVTCSATDNHGNLKPGGFTVTVQDTTPPSVTPPADIVAEATSAFGAAVTYSGATATDLVDGLLTPTCAPASDSIFALGTTTVTCSATDSHGNTDSANFPITVQDTTAPVIANHAAVTAEATSASGAAVSYISPATSDAVDGAGTAICVPASGSTFSLGNTTVTCNATDAAGNHTAPTIFVVLVVDTTAPVIAAHNNETAQATSASGAVVNYTSPTTTDAVDGNGTATCSPASGSAFVLGDTTVTCTASDAHGNQATPATFVVQVVDTTAPIVTVPGDLSTGPTGVTGSNVTYSASATDLVDGSLTPTCSPASGSLFSFGTTTVTCSATDSHGNTGSKTFNVTISSFTFTGFFQPVDNGQFLNTVKNGSTVPVKWKLQGQGGIAITSVSSVMAGWPKAQAISCGTLGNLPEDTIETTVTGGTSLRYDTTAIQFIYNWKTPTQPNTCLRLDIKFSDGMTKSAYFKLK